MANIRILDKHVAELIAAGEVVERPASVIKELLENSIDAHASAVTVEITHGGISLIRIVDNGCGIVHREVPLAFVRHATSKIAEEGDLEHISTLGFRGEALASVAAVARVNLITCAQEEDTGTHYTIEGGVQTVYDEAGCSKGTVLEVRDLFYNTPARMKFLKKDVAEANAVAGVVDRIALSHPEVSIRFIREGKEQLFTPGNGKLLDAIHAVYGGEFAKSLIPLDYEHDGVRVKGYVSKPIAARSNRNMQLTYINGRFVRSKTVMAALSEAYQNAIMAGKFPAAVLQMALEPQWVDANVHPAKIEVRFVQEKPIFDAIYYGVKTALQQGDERPQIQLSAPKPSATAAPVVQPPRQMSFPAKTVQKERPAPESETVFRDAGYSLYEVSKVVPAAVVPNSAVVPQKSPSLNADVAPHPVQKSLQQEDTQPQDVQNPPPSFQILGEAFETYIIAQVGDAIWFIDKHAAHERMIFNRLYESRSVPQPQMLLAPVPVSLSKEEYGILLENRQLLADAGFELEDFGAGTVLIRAVPVNMESGNVSALIEEIAAKLLDNRQNITPEKMEWLYHSVACRAAVKAGDHSQPQELARLVSEIVELDEVKYCPHGRPVAFRLTRKELEKQFGRQI